MTLRIIGGKLKGRLLKSPKSTLFRPTQGIVRESVFNICQDRIEGAYFLDLYAGSGAMGFEALSRGAKRVTFVENHRQAIACIRENISFLKVEAQTELLPLDAAIALERLSTPFHLIYIDPPYDSPTAPLIERIIARQLLAPEALLFVEERSTSSAPPFQSPSLYFKDSRRFGAAVLHQYNFYAT